MIPTLEELNFLHDNMCQAVGDPRRMQIMYALQYSHHNVTALADLLGIPQPTVSRHLALLRQRGLVVTKREGASVYYRLADPRIIEVLDLMRTMMRDVVEQHSSMLEEQLQP